ncbi:MAG TPA: OsmC family protein [Terriglobia bacterium]|nr:OsmC family protein [Terriglobia bacterium]
MLEAKLHLSTFQGSRRQFIGESASGHRVVMDDAEGNTGPRPIEFALLALGGCTAFDVISILRKMRQRVSSYEVELSADQRTEPPCVFTRVNIKHRLHGQITPQAAQKAIHLSETKYCSVGAMIGETAEITNTFEIIPENDLPPEDSSVPSLIAPMSS